MLRQKYERYYCIQWIRVWENSLHELEKYYGTMKGEDLQCLTFNLKNWIPNNFSTRFLDKNYISTISHNTAKAV